ncbi:hypothetical protein LTR08_005255 [Meristemomyces frigidus]|nr:hypothetical protein LTR08_005255 [Meristemomyces frigidus]
MAQTPSIAMALATPTPSVDIPNARDAGHTNGGFPVYEKLAVALLTPPNSISPDLPARGIHPSGQSPPPINIGHESDLRASEEHLSTEDYIKLLGQKGTPLSKGALSGLDASAAITPGMLAKYHLPGIMLGNGPKPIRYVMGELTQSVPGFSRILPAKARRLVVAALESRHGGGVDGNITFCKTGWGRWDAHVKGSSRDSVMGSLNEGHLSPPRSERSSYAFSHGDSAVHMLGPRVGYRDQHSGGSWTASSLREEDELDMEMDVPENEADKMSLDGMPVGSSDSESLDEATDEEDWPATGSGPLRKASLPTPGAPRRNYNAISAAYARRWPSQAWSRRPSAVSERPFHSASVPSGGLKAVDLARVTPEEQAAAAALISMGSM